VVQVLIDDRRIHVDFSQSVAKLWGAWKRGVKNVSHHFDSNGQLKLDSKKVPCVLRERASH
jgi:hypothetical protein